MVRVPVPAVAPLFDTWRGCFGEYVQRPSVADRLKTASLAEDLRSWTSELTTAVVRSCEAAGWIAAAKWNPCRRLPKGGNEYLGVDVMAFPSEVALACRWPLPLAAFELENARSDDRVAYSLWKVLCIRTTLRVEECRLLDLGEFARKGAFVPWYAGFVSWLHGERVVASIGYTVRPDAGDGLILRLSYRMTQTGEDVDLPIRLENTPLHFGGVRWWGRCPLVVNNVPCTRRVRKLYLPPGGRYFGCRTCYRLSYCSVQEHDKRVDALVRNPEAFEAAYQEFMTEPGYLGNITKAGLILKASAKLQRKVEGSL